MAKDRAFVCHQSKEEMEASKEIAKARDGRPGAESPWRNRPVAESLRELAAMRAGRYEEGAATLRLKVDMAAANPTLWDPVAYRIKFSPHPVTGDAWCIYPTYDFSHCIIDSLEHIDFSLCTLEFEVRRDIYYWVLEQLDLYRPHVYEFSRLNITATMLSKRKILKLVRFLISRRRCAQLSSTAFPPPFMHPSPERTHNAGRGRQGARLG